MEYTDEEIEMLARFWCASLGGIERDADSSKRTAKEVRLILDGAPTHMSSGLILRAAARLMREAREQGLATARDEIRQACEREQATWDQLHHDVKAARAQGAAEMRERASRTVRELPEDGWGNEDGECSPWPIAAAAIETLPLKVPQ